MTEFKPGDRVQHINGKWTGQVLAVHDNRVWVWFDGMRQPLTYRNEALCPAPPPDPVDELLAAVAWAEEKGCLGPDCSRCAVVVAAAEKVREARS